MLTMASGRANICKHERAFVLNFLSVDFAAIHFSFSSSFSMCFYCMFPTVVVVVVLLFYVHGKHLRSCRDGQLT